MRRRETQCREEEKSRAEKEKKKKVEKSTNLPTIGFFWRAGRRPGPPLVPM
jgi:hypothetical protein